MKHKVVLLDGDENFLGQLSQAFEAAGWAVCPLSDGQGAVAACKDASLLVTELILPGVDGLSVIEEVKRTSSAKVLVLSEVHSQELISKVLSLGGDYFLSKPVSPELVCARAKLFGQEETLSPQPDRAHFLDERLTNVFLTVGIPANIKGYQYLKVGIKLAVERPSIIGEVTKGLYPEIARRCATSPSRVERAIRHAIDVAWCRGKIQNINTVFGLKIYTASEKPTNSEFIALLADKMLLELYGRKG